MAGKENRRAQMTKLLLRTALIELLEEKPLSRITIRELCEKADLNRTTFYLHYTDQNALLEDIERDVMEKTMEAMQDIHTDPRTTMLVEAFLSYIKSNDRTFRLLLCRDDSEHFRRVFVTELRRVMAANLPSYGDARQTEYVLSFLMYGSLYVIIEWMQNGYSESPEEIAALLFKLSASIG